MNKKLVTLIIFLFLIAQSQVCAIDETVSNLTDINENAFTVSETDGNSSSTEQKTLNEVQNDFSKLKLGEKFRARKKLKKMTVKERQEALADKVKPTVLEEEIVNSTTIQGGVVENVIVSIEDCVKLALINNPSIRYAISNSDIYKSKIGQAWSAYFPQFSIGTSFSKNKFLSTFIKPPTSKYDLWNAIALEGSQLIYDFGKTQKQAKVAKISHEASLDELQTTINDTVYNVKSAYFQYLYALRQNQVLVSTVEKYEKHLKEAQAGYDVGVRAKIDVITAEYNLSNAKLDLIKTKHQVELAKAHLNNAMGLPTYANYNVTDKLEVNDYSLNFDELMTTAYALRPELQAVTKKAEASKILVTSSKLAYTPDLKGFGSYQVGGKEYADDYGYQVGVQLSYPVTNFLKLKQQVNEAKSTYERDLADLDKAKNDVYLDVKSAYIQYENAKESVPVAQKAMDEAKLQYEIAAGRYKSGLSNAVELKDAEVTYRTAQLNYYSSLMDYNTAVASVEKVVGKPIEPQKVNNLHSTTDVNL